MNTLKTNLFLKIGVIILLMLILLIPTAMVKGLIDEREQTQKFTIEEISEKWATNQTITGPFVSIPYDRYIETTTKKDSVKTYVKTREFIHLLPENLTINGEVIPEKRYRGIYEVVVYESTLSIAGSFSSFDLQSLEIDEKDIHLDKASVIIGISDLKGIENQISIAWNSKAISFDSGVPNDNIISSGISTQLDLSDDIGKINAFSTEINLKGSQQLYFLPFGKTTEVQLKSNWTTPSFNGEYLPDSRNINEHGFDAKWNVLHLNRNYPQWWTNTQYYVHQSSFGADLILPVDNYKKSDRVAKYALLFIGLTFLVFFFVEVLGKVFIHPVQYLLVGLALIVFYTLLLSFSEHMVFNLAYMLATVLTLTLVSFYSYAILKSKKLATLIFGILLILYAFIFTTIQLEDYALLLGSLGVFAILTLVMYHSRTIDWYNIKLNGE